MTSPFQLSVQQDALNAEAVVGSCQHFVVGYVVRIFDAKERL